MKQFFWMLLTMAMAGSLSAQTNDTLRFTLTEAIDYAVKNNLQLKSTQLNEENNRFRIKEVRAGALPQLNGSGSGVDNFSRATQLLPGELLGQPGTTIPVQFGTRFVYSGGIQLNQTLYNPSLNVGLKAATQSQGLYELQTFKTEEDLVYNLANLYVQLQMTEKQKELLAGNIDRIKRLLEITNAQFKEGIIKKVDLDQLKVNFTNLQTQLASVDNNYSQLLNNIKLLMNIIVDQPITLVDDPGGVKVNVSRQLNVDANTELNIIDKQIQLQQLNTDNIKAGYKPSLSLGANFGRQWQTNTIFKGSGTSGFSSGYYSVNLALPIFDGNRKKNQVAQSSIATKQLALNKEYLANTIRSQFQTATNNLNQNQRVLQAQSQNIKVAEDLYNVARLSYTEGVAALSELINAENGLREAQSQYLTAMLQTNLAELETMRTSGQLSQLIKDNTNR